MTNWKTLQISHENKERLRLVARSMDCSMSDALEMLLKPIYELLASFKQGTVTMTSLTSVLGSEVTFQFRGRSRLIIGEESSDEAISEKIREKVKKQ